MSDKSVLNYSRDPASTIGSRHRKAATLMLILGSIYMTIAAALVILFVAQAIGNKSAGRPLLNADFYLQVIVASVVFWFGALYFFLRRYLLRGSFVAWVVTIAICGFETILLLSRFINFLSQQGAARPSAYRIAFLVAAFIMMTGNGLVVLLLLGDAGRKRSDEPKQPEPGPPT